MSDLLVSRETLVLGPHTWRVGDMMTRGGGNGGPVEHGAVVAVTETTITIDYRKRPPACPAPIVNACEWHPINPPQFSLRVWLHGSQFHCGFLVASEDDCRAMAELLVPAVETKEDEDGFSRSVAT